MVGIIRPARTLSSTTAPRPRGRPYCWLDSDVRRASDGWRTKALDDGRCLDRAARVKAVCHALMLAE